MGGTGLYQQDWGAGVSMQPSCFVRPSASLSEQGLGYSTSTSQIRRFTMAWQNQKIMLAQLSGLRTSVHPSAIRRMKLVGPLIPGKPLLSRDAMRQRRQSGDCLPAVLVRGSAPATNKRALPIGREAITKDGTGTTRHECVEAKTKSSSPSSTIIDTIPVRLACVECLFWKSVPIPEAQIAQCRRLSPGHL